MASGGSIGCDWQAGLRVPALDRRGRELDLAPLRTLITRIVSTWQPREIWLFGSRARGEASATSDWDLLVVVPDTVPDGQLDPRVGWTLQKGSGVRAGLIPCRASDFDEARGTVNTLAYEATTDGVLVYGRCERVIASLLLAATDLAGARLLAAGGNRNAIYFAW